MSFLTWVDLVYCALSVVFVFLFRLASYGTLQREKGELSDFEHVSVHRTYTTMRFKESAEILPFYVLQVLLAYFLFFDFQRGLRGSNGRFVSFMQSVESVYKYKRGHAKPSKNRPCEEKFFSAVYICCVCAFLKWAPGTVVSFWLDLTPTWMRGWRHAISFSAALVWIHFSPRNFVFRFFHTSTGCRVLLHTATALYKLRKLVFLVQASYNKRSLTGFMASAFLLSVWELEGGTTSRRVELYATTKVNRQSTLLKVYRDAKAAVRLMLYQTNAICSFCAAWILHFSWTESDVGPIKYPFPFHVKLIVLLIIWYRYNVDDVGEIVAWVRSVIVEVFEQMQIIYRWGLHTGQTCLPFIFSKPAQQPKSRSVSTPGATLEKAKQASRGRRRGRSRRTAAKKKKE